MSAALKQQLPWIKRTVMAALGIAPPADPNVVETQADSQFSAFEETQADAVTAHDVLGLAGQVIQLISVDCTGDCHRVVLSDRQHTIVAYVSDAGDAIALGQSRSDEVPDTRAALVKRKGGLFVLDAFYVATERIALPGFQHVGAPRFCLVIDRMRYWGSAGAVGTPRDLRSDDAVARILANTPVKRLHEVLAHVQRPPRASAFSRSFSEFLPWAARPERKKGLARRPRGSAAPGAMVVLDAEAHRVPFNQHALLPELVDGLVAGVPPTASASSSSSVTGAPAAVLVSETRAARAAAPEHDVQTQGLTIANHLAKFKTSMSVPGRGLVRIPVGAGFAKPVAELYATDPTFCAEYAAAIATPMDIGTIQKRLRAGARFYGDDVEKLYRDFELIVSNCRTFNVGVNGTESCLLASELEAECKRLFALRFPLHADAVWLSEHQPEVQQQPDAQHQREAQPQAATEHIDAQRRNIQLLVAQCAPKGAVRKGSSAYASQRALWAQLWPLLVARGWTRVDEPKPHAAPQYYFLPAGVQRRVPGSRSSAHPRGVLDSRWKSRTDYWDSVKLVILHLAAVDPGALVLAARAVREAAAEQRRRDDAAGSAVAGAGDGASYGAPTAAKAKQAKPYKQSKGGQRSEAALGQLLKRAAVAAATAVGASASAGAPPPPAAAAAAAAAATAASADTLDTDALQFDWMNDAAQSTLLYAEYASTSELTASVQRSRRAQRAREETDLANNALEEGAHAAHAVAGCLVRRDNAGMLPLHYAAEEGSLPCVELLLRRGADPHAQPRSIAGRRGPTALILAAQQGHGAVVDALLCAMRAESLRDVALYAAARASVRAGEVIAILEAHAARSSPPFAFDCSHGAEATAVPALNTMGDRAPATPMPPGFCYVTGTRQVGDGRGCRVCQRIDDAASMLLCDGCESEWHMACVGLAEVPTDAWFCRGCAVSSAVAREEQRASSPAGAPAVVGGPSAEASAGALPARAAAAPAIQNRTQRAFVRRIANLGARVRCCDCVGGCDTNPSCACRRRNKPPANVSRDAKRR